MTEYEASLLEIMTKNLQSECRERRHLALRGLVVLGPTNPPMVRREQLLKPSQQCEAGECSRLGMTGLQGLGQLLPALLPPSSAAQVLWDRPLASRPCSSRAAFHTVAFHTGKRNVRPD